MSQLILIHFTYFFVLIFPMNLKDANYKSHLNYFSILRPIKDDVRFKYVPWKDV